MNAIVGYLAVAAVSAITIVISVYGLRLWRSTSDFYVASRSVRPWWNASAIGGEYLSAASFLGVAGLILTSGVDGLWYPIGYTAGYLMLLLFVAAPLRRSGAYTVSDFAHTRLQSQLTRRCTTVLVVLVSWLYIVPQLHGAALALRISTGLPGWVGSVVVIAVVTVSVIIGGMRSITFAQAFQFWLKLTAIAVPVVFAVLVLSSSGQPITDGGAAFSSALNTVPDPSTYTNVSLVFALLLGTLGLPHVLVRFYTNPDGRSARRTTLIVLALLGLFYLFPTMYGVLGRIHTRELALGGRSDATVLLLPAELIGGPAGTFLSALVIAGAFAAFLSTTSGLLVSSAGVISQDLFDGGVRGFRIAALLSAVGPLAVALATDSLGLAGSVGLVFAFTASTIAPLLLLGIWWEGLSDIGALAGMVAGGALCGAAILCAGLAPVPEGLAGELLAQPAAWTVPTAFAVMIAVSKLTPQRRPAAVAGLMARLHAPERAGR